MKPNFICILTYGHCFFFSFWLHWVFVALGRLSLVAVSRGSSLLWCTGFALQGLLWHTGSRCLQITVIAACRLSSCSMWALDGCGAQSQLLCRVQRLLGPEMNLDQGPRTYSGPLNWKADSYPLCHHGSPEILYFNDVEYPFQEHGISFHLLKSTVFSFRSVS